MTVQYNNCLEKNERTSIDANKENSDPMGKKHRDKYNMHILQCQANFYQKLAKNLDINNQKNSQVFSINFPINAI